MGLFDLFKKKKEEPSDNDVSQIMALIAPGGYEFTHISECIKRNRFDVLYQSPTCFCLYDNVTECYFIEEINEEDVKVMIDELRASYVLNKVLTTSDFVRDYLKDKYPYNHYENCYQAVCVKPPKQPKTDLIISPAEGEDIYYIQETYKEMSLEDIQDRFDKECMWVARLQKDGPIVAYCGIHNDGTVGFEYVTDSQRRKGYGSAMMLYATYQALEKSLTPYVHILKHNVSSLRLHNKIGYETSRLSYYWLFDEYQ